MNQHLAIEQVSLWVQRFASLLKPGPVLDLACGGGRHSRFFAKRGHLVHALDRDAVVIAKLQDDQSSQVGAAQILPKQIDLEVPLHTLQWPFAPGSLAGIVVTNYLHRPLFPLLLRSLADDGVFIMETFAQDNGRFGKPSNPDFLLAPGELILHMQAAAEMRIVAYEDGRVMQPKEAMVQRVCAQKQAAQAHYFQMGPI